MRDLLDILTAAAGLPDGEPFTLATVVGVVGSSYRSPGARMLVDAAGRRVGSVSGGCLESEVARRGRLLSAEHPSAVVRFDSTDEDAAWGFGLGCNGAIDVLIERCVDPADGGLDFFRDCNNRRVPGAMATLFDGTSIAATTSTATTTTEPSGSAAGPSAGLSAAFSKKSSTVTVALLSDTMKSRWQSRSAPLSSLLSSRAKTPRLVLTEGEIVDPFQMADRIPGILSDLTAVARSGRSACVRYDLDSGPVDAFLEPIRPPLPVVIFGAGHDAVPLVNAAKNLGWHVTVWDRRAGHARPDRFPTADAVVSCDPAHAFGVAGVSGDTVAIVMNHHYPTDTELVGRLLDLPARYVGVLGPRARTDRIIAGRTEPATLFAPVGLDLGADGPEQVAVAVVAEILATLSGRAGGPLRLRDGPIHLPPRVIA